MTSRRQPASATTTGSRVACFPSSGRSASLRSPPPTWSAGTEDCATATDRSASDRSEDAGRFSRRCSPPRCAGFTYPRRQSSERGCRRLRSGRRVRGLAVMDALESAREARNARHNATRRSAARRHRPERLRRRGHQPRRCAGTGRARGAGKGVRSRRGAPRSSARSSTCWRGQSYVTTSTLAGPDAGRRHPPASCRGHTQPTLPRASTPAVPPRRYDSARVNAGAVQSVRSWTLRYHRLSVSPKRGRDGALDRVRCPEHSAIGSWLCGD